MNDLLVVPQSVMHEVANLRDGMFAPIDRYMGKADFHSVVTRLKLASGEPFPLPVSLSIPRERDDIVPGRTLALALPGHEPFAEMEIVERFRIDPETVIEKLFGTRSLRHPGVVRELHRGQWRVAGPIKTFHASRVKRNGFYKTPEEIRRIKKNLGLRTLVGFQTRNVVHRAHEHLIRTGLEMFDAILIQPLVGARKAGDFSEQAIVGAYKAFIKNYLPEKRVLFATWQVSMWYAGPREAMMHALVRRNFGCTHFIIGRDQAGVGNFYGKYEAQSFCLDHPVPGIQIVPLAGPFYCKGCCTVVTERTCRHVHTNPDKIQEVSGSRIRNLLLRRRIPGPELLRPEVARFLRAMPPKKMFITQADHDKEFENHL